MDANVNDELFDGGPLTRWERSLGLLKSRRSALFKRTLLSILIGWVPLAVLSAIQFLFWSDQLAKSFFSDFAVHARFLLAVPALIYAEAECLPRLGRIVAYFEATGLVAGPDIARYETAVSSTRRLLASSIGDIVLLVLVYLVVAVVAVYFSSEALLPWQRREAAGLHLSPAGWWHALVSLPLLLLIFFVWIWRLALWTRFLFLMSRLDLRLIAAHPDRVGGLKFVSSSLRGFRLISFGCGAVVAGSILNRQVHQGSQPFEFQNLLIGLLVFLVILFAGPMTIFLKKLRETKRRGTFEYGALAMSVGKQFEARWLPQRFDPDRQSLDAQDFSATNDLYSIVGNVSEMREVPFTLRDLIGPIGVAAILPFLPLAVLAMPLEVILRGLVKLLF